MLEAMKAPSPARRRWIESPTGAAYYARSPAPSAPTTQLSQTRERAYTHRDTHTVRVVQQKPKTKKLQNRTFSASLRTSLVSSGSMSLAVSTGAAPWWVIASPARSMALVSSLRHCTRGASCRLGSKQLDRPRLVPPPPYPPNTPRWLLRSLDLAWVGLQAHAVPPTSTS